MLHELHSLSFQVQSILTLLSLSSPEYSQTEDIYHSLQVAEEKVSRSLSHLAALRARVGLIPKHSWQRWLRQYIKPFKLMQLNGDEVELYPIDEDPPF
jgi:hypothetical protein